MSIAASVLQGQSWVVVTETEWPATPKIFTKWALKKKSRWPWPSDQIISVRTAWTQSGFFKSILVSSRFYPVYQVRCYLFILIRLTLENIPKKLHSYFTQREQKEREIPWWDRNWWLTGSRHPSASLVLKSEHRVVLRAIASLPISSWNFFRVLFLLHHVVL